MIGVDIKQVLHDGYGFIKAALLFQNHAVVEKQVLVIGIGGLLFRTLHLFVLQDVRTGLTWAAKILTDPFHDVKLYYRAPFHLLRGELIDPNHARHPT